MTIKPVLWYRANKHKEYFIKIRITENIKVKYINLNVAIPKRFWNKERVTKGHPDAERLNSLIRETINTLEVRYAPSKKASPPSKEVVTEISTSGSTLMVKSQKLSVGAILQEFVTEFRANGKIGSAKKHVVVLNHTRSCGIDLVGLNEFDKSHVNLFRAYLTDKAQVQPQGRHTYEKVIKKVFNHAAKMGYRQGQHPYLGVSFKVPKPRQPRHLSKFALHGMEERFIYGKQSPEPFYVAISMFLFSTYTYGMRFGDVASLRWSDIQDFRLDYKMRKTDQPIAVRITEKHANLIKYFLPDTIYPKIFKAKEDIYESLVADGTAERHPIVQLEKNYYDWKLEFIERIKSLPKEKWTYNYVKKNNPLNPEERKDFNAIVAERDRLLIKLINQHSKSSDERIYPLIKSNHKSLSEEYNDISSKNAIINKQLKVYAEKVPMSPFSFHASRHSFANNIRDVEPDILKISRMLGHKSLTLTQEYLKRFERIDDYKSNERFIGIHDDFLLIGNDDL